MSSVGKALQENTMRKAREAAEEQMKIKEKERLRKIANERNEANRKDAEAAKNHIKKLANEAAARVHKNTSEVKGKNLTKKQRNNMNEYNKKMMAIIKGNTPSRKTRKASKKNRKTRRRRY